MSPFFDPTPENQAMLERCLSALQPLLPPNVNVFVMITTPNDVGTHDAHVAVHGEYGEIRSALFKQLGIVPVDRDAFAPKPRVLIEQCVGCDRPELCAIIRDHTAPCKKNISVAAPE